MNATLVGDFGVTFSATSETFRDTAPVGADWCGAEVTLKFVGGVVDNEG